MKPSWSCEYCGTTYLTIRRCSEHEGACSHNPRNKTCDTCGNWFFDPNEGPQSYDGEPEGASSCKLQPEFYPFMRNCDAWTERIARI